MPINPLFSSNYDGNPEQNLVQDLIIESIQIYGLDFKYIPRKHVNLDELYWQDLISKFENAYDVEMHLKSFDTFGGEGDLFSRFDVEIRDELTVQVAKKRFSDLVTIHEPEVIRPREGDLIYFPFTQSVFEIKFVEHEEVFYQLGKLYTYEIRANLFEYNAEDFDTGVEGIDRIEEYSHQTTLDLDMGTGIYTEGETVTQEDNEGIILAAAEVVEWNEPVLTVKDVAGEFAPDGLNIVGGTSGASWSYTSEEFQDQNSNDELADNAFFDEEFDTFDIPTSTNKLR